MTQCLPPGDAKESHRRASTLGAGWLVLAAVAALVSSSGCRRIEPLPEPSPTPEAPTPVPEPTIDVRLFEKHAPRVLVVRGKMAVTTDHSDIQTAARVKLAAMDSLVQVNGGAFSDQVILSPLAGELRLDPGGPYERWIAGALRVRADEDFLVIIARMDLEAYVAGVVAAELTEGSPEALRAQAVIARTFALKEKGRHGWYDACDTTHCQVFKGVPAALYAEAAQATVGQILSADGCRPASVFYASTCGGHTASYRTIWPSRTAPRYLVGVPDLTLSGRPWCRRSPHLDWQFRIRAPLLAALLEDTYGVPPTTPLDLHLVFGTGGWVARVKVAGISDYITGEAFHRMLARAFGWGQFKSARFTVSAVQDKGSTTFVFTGHGLGHGVGLCQYGANAMAKAGLDWHAILQHYFPRLSVVAWQPRCPATVRHDEGHPEEATSTTEVDPRRTPDIQDTRWSP